VVSGASKGWGPHAHSKQSVSLPSYCLAEPQVMMSKVLCAALFIGLGGAGAYGVNHFRWQQSTAGSVQTDPSLSRADLETKYRLQERCADRAKEFYEERYAGLELELNRHRKPGSSFIHTVYQSHYNTRLNKCFIYAQTKYLPWDVKKTIEYTLAVQDVNTRQEYASYSKTECEVRGSTCDSELEWWRLVKPYIEELAEF
jgi:hypothetical protein